MKTQISKPIIKSTSRKIGGAIYLRKTLKLGNSSLVITLPKKWLNLVDAKTGSYLFLRQRGFNLTISPQISPTIAPIGKIQLNEVQNAAVEFYGLYVQGINLIKVENYSEQQAMSDLSSLIDRHLLGVQIIEETNNVTTFQVFSKESSDPQVLLKRLRIILINLFSCYSSILTKKTNNSRKVQSLLRSGFKLFFLSLRRVYGADEFESSELNPPTYRQLISYALILRSISKVFDYLSSLNQLSNIESDLSEISSIFENCCNYYLQSINRSLMLKQLKNKKNIDFQSIQLNLGKFIEEKTKENPNDFQNLFKISLSSIGILNEAQNLLATIVDSNELPVNTP